MIDPNSLPPKVKAMIDAAHEDAQDITEVLEKVKGKQYAGAVYCGSITRAMFQMVGMGLREMGANEEQIDRLAMHLAEAGMHQTIGLADLAGIDGPGDAFEQFKKDIEAMTSRRFKVIHVSEDDLK